MALIIRLSSCVIIHRALHTSVVTIQKYDFDLILKLYHNKKTKHEKRNGIKNETQNALLFIIENKRYSEDILTMQGSAEGSEHL